MLHPRRLAILREVVAAGSVNAAARNLNYAPATISQHLSSLSRETGLVLFTRQGRGIVATDAARRLAEQAGALLADFGRLERVVADLRGGQAEHLAIACFASAAEQWIAEVVRTIRRHRPQLTVEVSLNEPVDGRGRRQPDLDIRSEPDGGAGRRLDGYRRHELCVEDFVAVLPRGHRLAGSREVALAELEAESWVDHDLYDSPSGQIVLNGCRAAGFTPRYAARLDDHRSALRLVAAGIGVTLLPRLAVAGLAEERSSSDRDLVAVPVVRPTPRRRIVVHARADARRAELIARALARLRACAQASDSPGGA